MGLAPRPLHQRKLRDVFSCRGRPSCPGGAIARLKVRHTGKIQTETLPPPLLKRGALLASKSVHDSTIILMPRLYV
jgi:hypothetical protein